MAAPMDHAEPGSSQDIWMVRPCEAYHDEYKECKSFKGRFHQYYIFGQTSDCSQWKKDWQNCLKYRNTGSEEAVEALIDSEQERRKKRISAAQANDVWEYRTKPPEEWNSPLPEYLQRMKIPEIKPTERACTIL